jgi:radical SAM protein with 4Fe4S-binding SPASM domain
MTALKEVGVDSLSVSRFLAEKDPLGILAGELGPKFAEYRAKWDLAKSFRYDLPFPLHVDYELMAKCSLRCPMCPNSRPDNSSESGDLKSFGRSESRLLRETVLDLLAEGAAAGQGSMGFGGLWEPLLARELPELVAAGRELGLVDAMLNTNGQLLTEKISEALIKAGLTRLMISVDAATEATYALARPGGDFRLLENNIQEFLAKRKALGKRLPVLRLSYCVTSLNERELPAFLAKWEGRVDFFSVQSYGRFTEDAPALFPKNYDRQIPGGLCAQPRKRLLVRHNGEVTPCCDLSGFSLSLGNVKNLSLAKIWEGPKIAEIRKRLSGPKENWPSACLACQAKYR